MKKFAFERNFKDLEKHNNGTQIECAICYNHFDYSGFENNCVFCIYCGNRIHRECYIEKKKYNNKCPFCDKLDNFVPCTTHDDGNPKFWYRTEKNDYKNYPIIEISHIISDCQLEYNENELNIQETNNTIEDISKSKIELEKIYNEYSHINFPSHLFNEYLYLSDSIKFLYIEYNFYKKKYDLEINKKKLLGIKLEFYKLKLRLIEKKCYLITKLIKII